MELENKTKTQIKEKYHQLTQILLERKLMITTMESATAGLIASLITDTEGSSAVMKGAFVTYSNEAKIKQGVPAEVIERYGVYSKETALEMAKMCRQTYGADIGIGVTGTMGNVDPANQDSIPGQVYFAIVYGTDAYACYRELPVQETRSDYKMVVAGEVVDELLQCLSKTKSI